MLNIPSPIVFILALSIIVQATAATMAFRLIKITGRRLAWILIAVALTLMAVRRVVPLYRLSMGDLALPPDPVNEIIGLALSAAMAVGIARIAPLFLERQQAEADRLAHLQFLENLDRVNLATQGANDLQQMMRDTLKTTLSIFACDRSWLFYPCDPEAPTFRVPMEITRPEYPGAGILDAEVPMPPDMALNLRETLESPGPVTYGFGTERPVNQVSREHFGVQSMMMVALYPKSGKPWLFGLHQCSSPRVWTAEEQRLFQEIGRRLADALTGLLSLRDLQESAEKYRRLVDTANEGIWVFGEDLLTSFVNARMAEMLGYQGSEMLGRPLTDFMFEEDIPDHRNRVENRHRGLSEHYERRCCHKNGQPVWTLVSAVPILDAEQNFQGSFAMFTDITERKRAEQRERQLQEYLQMQIDRLPIGLIVWDSEFRVTSWNPAAADIFGFTAAEALGKHPYDFIVPKEAQAAVDEIWARLIQGDMTAYSENENSTKDGRTILCDWTNTPLHDADGATTSVLSMVQDITERKQTEEKILGLNEELEQRVKERTQELERRNHELEEMNKAFVGRELRMVELKARIKELEDPQGGMR